MKNEQLVLILQNLILFPNQEVKLELNNSLSKSILKRAENGSRRILIVSPRDELEVRPDIKELPEFASLSSIENTLSLPNGNIRVILRGIKRVRVTQYKREQDVIQASFEAIKNPPYNLEEELAYTRKLKHSIEEYVNACPNASNSILGIIKNVSSLSKLTDIAGAIIEFSYKEKWNLFNETNYYKRAKRIIELLSNEVSSMKIEKKIDEEIRENFEKSEKEIYIKEKIDLLSKEIGIRATFKEECQKYLNKINSFKIDNKIKNNFIREVKRLESTVETSPEFGIIRSYLEFITEIPWNRQSKDKKDIQAIDRHLNELHYGLSRAKDRIEEYLILKNQNRKLNSPVLCLVGPPGVGKTTFARELANSIGREFIKISVGGLNDSAELIGHRRTYIGAGAGKIMEGIRKAGVNNPVILIDEVDKMVKDYKGDPSSVLLDILDQNQNKEFIDNYVSEPFDLSNVLFILTANDVNSIPIPLLDRLEIIDVNSYTLFDKVEIIKNYTLPRLGKEYNFDYKKLIIKDRAIIKIANEYTKEAGVRDLERHVASIVRKILIKNINKQVIIDERDVANYLGPNKYTQYINKYDKYGTTNVPAVNETGGIVLNVECTIYEGNEKIIATGSLGEVMKESAEIAVSHIKSNCKNYKVDMQKLSQTIHINALDAASKKEGPSAGLAIAVALMSYLTKKKVPNDIAFTGEISLEGRILKVGGIKEKIISCYNQGIKKIFIPLENIKDVDEVPKKIVNRINIVPINNFTEVYTSLFD